MKGRRTSFQRFGSVLGATGSVVHKFTRSLGGDWPQDKDKYRDSDFARPAGAGDCSDGKGIYNKTIKSNDELKIDTGETDLGEEVYGCISHGFGNTNTIEKDAKKAKDGRDVKRAGSKHFDPHKRLWYHHHGSTTTGGAYGVLKEDSTLIPQENVPQVVNSKFEIKYWQEANKDAGIEAEMIEIPKGAGFTSGTLVRPVAFTDKAEELKNGSLNASNMRSHILRAVPMKTAHAILNRCKEILLTGSVNYSVERTNKECSGGKSSKYEWEEEAVTGCPPGSCEDIGGSITLSCASTKLTTKVLLDGDISMTAYRYKQLKDIWDKPETLDISGNYLEGRQGEYVGYFKVSNSSCEAISSAPTKLPIPQIEQLAKFEKQTKLSSGCLTYPSTNSSMLNATLEDNLKMEEISADNCKNAVTQYGLETIYRTEVNYYYNYSYSNIFPSGVDQFDNIICPKLASGPSLRANFLGIGWDFSGVGKDGPEDAYSKDCSDKDITNFYNYKGKWNSTGITRTIEDGECPLGISGLSRYDADAESVEDCKCDDACEDCKKNYGDVRLVCDCQPMCTPVPNKGNPCKDGEIKGGCDGTYQITMEIGKYVGVEIDPENQYHNVAAIPLSAKMDTKTEDLTIWWRGEFNQPDANGISLDRNLGFYLNQASAKNSNPKDNSVTRWENKEIGTLTIVCDDWSMGVPLWGQVGVAKETTCKGTKSGYNTYSTSKNAGNTGCIGCDEDSDKPDCCTNGADGCGGSGGGPDGCCNSDPCGIDDPCGYAVLAIGGAECRPPDCGGECSDQDNNECGCCGCEFEAGTSCEICDPYVTCKPFKVISNYEEMGCYGDAHEEDKHEAEVNLTLEFKLFTKTE